MTTSNLSAQNRSSTTDEPIYGRTARFYHWVVVFLIAIQFPLGLYMHYRAHDMKWVNPNGVMETGLFDATTKVLYDSHKLLGLVLLALILARLYYRLTAGAPRPESSLSSWYVTASKFAHALIYATLIAVPFLGYLGAAYFGATTLFGTVHVPSIVIQDKEFARDVIDVHMLTAYGLLALIVVHVLAALYHQLIRRDQVMARMIPALKRKSTTT